MIVMNDTSILCKERVYSNKVMFYRLRSDPETEYIRLQHGSSMPPILEIIRVDVMNDLYYMGGGGKPSFCSVWRRNFKHRRITQ